MERDPLRLAWKTDPARHLLGFLLLAVAGGLLVLGLHLVRMVTDLAMGAADPAAPFLSIALSLPEMTGRAPLVLFPGFTLAPDTHLKAAIGALILVPVLVALVLTLLNWVTVAIRTRTFQRILSRMLDVMLKASPATADVTDATELASETLSREGGILGSALISSVRQGGMIGLCVALVLVTEWRLGLTLAAMLVLGGILNARRALLRVDTAKARRREGEGVEAAWSDLIHRLPALRAHGTASFERERIGRTLAQRHGPVLSRERRLALAESFAAGILMLAPLALLAVGAWLSPHPSLTAGALAASALAGALAAYGVRELVAWQQIVDRTRLLLGELARSLSAMEPRDRPAVAALPQNGALVAKGVSAYDPASGARISSVDLHIAFPSHVALVGDGDAGPRLLAALIGGQLSPSTGQLTYGGTELSAADPVSRAHRIALAGDTVLFPGSMRDNLVYGAAAPAAELDRRLIDAVETVGLDGLIHARGLAGTVDPKREPDLAAALVETRRDVRKALAREGLDRFVDPFDPKRFNRYATVGENLLFGKAIGDTFREDRLAGHPFVRAILEAEDLTKPLARMGLSIATSMIEIFADIPDGHPLFERFSFFSASDRTYFEDLVERRKENRRGVQTGRDQERLIGLALLYNESRHRLGLLDAGLEMRIVAARADFTRMLPVSLQPAIEFYDEGRLCTAASVQDNLLFGRIAADQAGAEEAVQKVIRRVLTDRGLDDDVSRIGLAMPVDPQGGDLTLAEIAAIDVVRCLVRRPDILVVQRALDGLPGPAADKLVADLRRAMIGRGLILVTPEITPAMDRPAFDSVIRFERGEPVESTRAATQPEAMSA
ncbi:ABC transporter ATP-binding protein/permease [Microvirga sp. 17 mud 1-3]|uniref:ABC transporter ATP-binding protein/permease n=1 Tax=Microvirga sp. 17 mud 1-3 TaxID=2082949 RepID=UPI000D6C06D1|nr:ABC transporter ATP-binding protein/permease [Microvirga sp. 17 mud 1-3]AWM88888.1 multidrug ABC transporter ATP-binding protein [Microvirga sp. 17 mud 1-3]